ncbi:hypothetical protein [uncultured Tateyamaria sp.]|uniref:hypothetical protein n=1 Tax=uncultured Tateyamaria sp. TaxID=455651 RepID=UPI002614C892|nr:hypothetical protein [uncultured Tateyamaria sp.]
MKRAASYWIAAALLIAAGILWLASRPLLRIETFGGVAENAPQETVPLSASEIEQRLLAVGLHPTGQLSDLGVDDHLARLEAGEVDTATLGGYADAIEVLSATSTDRGQALPPTLWDVSTPALRDAGWTVYTLTDALASEEGAAHVALLSDAYAAFLEHRPNALEGALALLPLSRAYVDTLPESARAERERHAQTDGQATLLIWQALLSGTSRHNPLTHRPLWSHGYIGHFSVPHIHQYAMGEGLTASQVWGVEGFNPTFVGPSANSNQVEHLGISALLQGVAHVPGAVLTATEAFEVFVDHEDPAAAQADRALSDAVRTVLLPGIEGDPGALVSALAEALR